MRSLWHLTAPEIPTQPFPDESAADVVVVGAGLTGVTTAVLLARAGRRVTVLEARSVGAVTTGNTTAKLCLLQGQSLSQIREHAGDDVLAAYLEANREGQAWLARELENRGAPLERRPAYTYATTEDGLDDLEAEREVSVSAGLPVSFTRDTGLPFTVTGAITLDDQVQLHPMAVLAALATELRERGGRIVDGCRVRGADVDHDGVALETSLGELTADIVVLATGIPILDRGMFFARVEPSRAIVAAYELSQDGAAPRGMYLSIDEPSRSLRTAHGPGGREVLVVGGGSYTTGRSDDTQTPFDELDAWTAQRFPASRRIARWAAQDYRAHSRIPFAGPILGGGDRVYAATGYNKWGMTNAIAAALTIVADIAGGHLHWARTLREHHASLQDARDAVAVNAAVAGNLVSGWADAQFGSTSVAEFEEGHGEVIREGVTPVAVARVGGELCRVSGVCTHLGGILNWNAAERSWDCPLHGSRFSATGRLLEGPAVRDLEQR